MDYGNLPALLTAASGLILGLLAWLKAVRADKKALSKEDVISQMQLSVSSVDGWKNLTQFLQDTVKQQGERMNSMTQEISMLKTQHTRCEELRLDQITQIASLQGTVVNLKGLCDELKRKIDNPISSITTTDQSQILKS